MSTWLRQQSFAGSVAVVTGSDGGIGRAVSHALASLGCAVVGCDVAAPPARDPAVPAEPHPPTAGTIMRHTVDVTTRADMEAAVAATVDSFGRLDFIVGCAGVVRPAHLTDVSGSDWRRSFDVNVDGMLHLARAAHPHLLRSPAPAAVAVASLSGASAYPGGGGYGPSKAALISLSRQLAVEWGKDGIRVNVVSPGPTLTPMLLEAQSQEYRTSQARRAPLQRLARPDEVADAVLYLLSGGARAVTGQVLAVDCGMSQTLLPGVTFAEQG